MTQCPPAGRAIPRLLSFMVLTLALCGGLGASCHPQIVENEPFGVGGSDEVEVEPEAKGDLDDAAALMAEGRHKEAREIYRGLAARFEGASGVASVLAAEAECREGAHKPAMDALGDLGEDEDQPTSVRRGALGYYALCAVRAGSRDLGIKLIQAQYPGQDPSSVWLADDRAAAMWLLAEARRRQGEPVAALGALSWVYELSGDENGRRLARSWALDMLRQHGEIEQLEEAASNSTDDFTRALAGAALILEVLAMDEPEVDFETLDRINGEISPALVRLDEGELAGEISRRLADGAGPRPVRLGALLPLSGRDRRVGAVALSGLLMAQGALRSDLGPRSTLILQDTRSTPEGAREGLEALAAQGVLAVVGPLDNQEARAAAAAAERLEVPLITLNLDASVTAEGPWVFRHFLDSRREIKALMARAKASGVRRLGILYPELSFGRDLVKVATEEAERAGIEVSVSLGYDPKASDYSKEGRKLRRGRVDAVYIPDVARRVGRVLPFLAAEQLWCSPQDAGGEEAPQTILCLGGSTWYQPELLRYGGTYVEGAVVAAAYVKDVATDRNRDFLEAHQREIGGRPELFTAFAYETVRLVRALLLAERLSEREAVREALSSLKGFEGLMGELSAGGEGELGSAPVLLRVKGKAFEIEAEGGP